MKIYMLESEDWANCSISKSDISKWVNQYALEAFGMTTS